MENKYQKPACALVRRGSSNVLYVVLDGLDVFCSDVLPNYPGLVIMPDVDLDFIALRSNGSNGKLFLVNVRYEKPDDAFISQGLVQACDNTEVVDIIERAKECGNLDSDMTVRDVMECNGKTFPKIDVVKLCECYGCHGGVSMHVCSFENEDVAVRRLFGDEMDPSPFAEDFVYLFSDGPVPVQLWPSDEYKFGSKVEREIMSIDEHDKQ